VHHLAGGLEEVAHRDRVVAQEAELVAVALHAVRDAMSGRERDHVFAARV
jgi:hypothetical protein